MFPPRKTPRLFVGLLWLLVSHSSLLAGGDVNGDSLVNVRDVAILTGHLTGDSPLAGDPLDKADIDRNGRVDASDRLRLMDLILFRDISSFIPKPFMEGENLRYPSVVSGGDPFDVTFGLTNTSDTVIDRKVVVRLWFSEDGQLGGPDDLMVGTYELTQPLHPGASILANAGVRAPLAEGDYRLVIELDANAALDIVEDERRFVVAPTVVSVLPPLTATVTAAESAVPVGTAVVLSGSAVLRSGPPAAFSQVVIRVSNGSFHRDLTAVTDSSGRFTAEWTPTAGDAGIFQIGAAHRGARSVPVQDSVQVLNLEVELDTRSITFAAGGSASISGTVRNPGGVSLSGFSFTAPGMPPGLDFNFSMPEGSSLAPGHTKNFTIVFNSLAGTRLRGSLPVYYGCNEGVRLEDTIDIQVVPPTGSLAVSTDLPLYEGVVRGGSRSFSVELSNEGATATGPIAVSLPNLPWLDLASASPLPSIPAGGTAKFSIRLRPDEAVPLTLYSGNLYLQPESGDGLSLPFEFRVVSDLSGGLEVIVEDELTYFTPANPKVEKATVKLRDPVTRELLETLVTTQSGTALFSELTEGFYQIEVVSPDHTRSERLIEVKPGRTQPVTVFIQKNFVTFHWDVVPIEIRDQYRITVESSFETNVPAPVVIMSPASIDVEDLVEVGDVKQIDLTFTNIGLIRAEDLFLSLPTNPHYEFIVNETDLGALPALSSVTVPLIVRRVMLRQEEMADPVAFRSGEPVAPLAVGCAPAAYRYAYHCGIQYYVRDTSVPLSGADDCPNGRPPFLTPPHRIIVGVSPQKPRSGSGIGGLSWYGGGGGGGGGGGAGGGGGGSGSAAPFTFSLPPADCFELPCPLAPMVACLPVPIIGDIQRAISCGQVLSEVFQGDLPGLGPVLDCIDPPYYGCLKSIVDCLPPPQAGRQIKTFGSPVVGELFTDADVAQANRHDPGVAAAMRRFSEVVSPLLYHYGDREVYLEASVPAATAWRREFIRSMDVNSSGGRDITQEEWDLLEAMALADSLDWTTLRRAVVRWDTTEESRIQGARNEADVDEELREYFIAEDVLAARVTRARAAVALSQQKGYSGPQQELLAEVNRLRNQVGNGSSGVCSRVTLQITQTAVLTRTAFEASLLMDNNTDAPMEQFQFDLEILDDQGTRANERFSVELDFVEGTDGDETTVNLPGGASGRFRWTIIPTDEAAPEGPQNYRFGGTILFLQGNTPYAIPVEPVELTVEPDARLHLKYFHQRDVYSDDPHTAEIEPSVPFALAVLVENRGAGPARNLGITSAQPEIIDNEFGLAIDFEIIATQVAGSPAMPTLEADFGEVPAGESKVANWFLTSSLQGFFNDYKASFEHLDSRGDPRLSLIQSVEIHEMIRMLEVPHGDGAGQPAFLVNELQSGGGLPDTVHRSDAATAPVAVHESLAVISDTNSGELRTIVIQTSLPAAGWSYLRTADPAGGGFVLEEVRDSANREIPLGSNVWQTDRTFIGFGLRPLRENRLHLADLNSTGRYTLLYRAIPPPDQSPPSSVLLIDAIRNGTDVILRWEGQDDRNVARYDVYVSTNGGAYALWLRGTRDTSAIFQGETGSTYSFYTIATDGAGNEEVLPASPGVGLPGPLQNNYAPVIEPITNQNVAEGSRVAFQVLAADPDGPASALRFSVTSPERGISINPFSGWLEWSSREGDGGRMIPVTVHVSDGGLPRVTSSFEFQIAIRDFNHPPVVPAIPPRMIPLGETFSQPVAALDRDLPPQALSFALVGSVPPGMAIDPNSGSVSWTPGEDAAGGNFLITVQATDAGTPALTGSRTFSLQVLDTRELLPLESVPVPNPVPGLTYAYYQGGWRTIPDFETLAPYKMGRLPAPDLAPKARSERFAFVFAGFLQIPEDGYYTFFAGARDALRVSIHGQTPFDFDPSHSTGEGFAPLRLAAGFHPVRIEYLRTSSPAAPMLHLEWEGPDFPRQPVPAGAWFTTFDTLRDPNAPLDSDLDGIPDHLEASFGFDPINPDTNGNGVPDGLEDADEDGIPNSFEIRYGLEPFTAESNLDLDADGLDFLDELDVGTDPFAYDTDGDSWNDEAELAAGSDPLDPEETPLHVVGISPAEITVTFPVYRGISVEIEAASPEFGRPPVVVDPTPPAGVAAPAVILDTREP